VTRLFRCGPPAIAVWVLAVAVLPAPAAAYEGIAVEADGSIVVTAFGTRSVYRIHPVTGATTVVSTDDVGSGPPFDRLRGIAVEADGALVVAEANAVTRVDPATGDRALISGVARGTGPLFLSLQSIEVAPDGTLFVADRLGAAVLRVDPSTGDRSNAAPFEDPNSLVAEPGGTLVVVDDRALVRLDPATGDRSILSDRRTGSGFNLRSPTGIAIEADGSLVVAEGASGGGIPISLLFIGLVREAALVRVDAASGDRTLISGGGTCLIVAVFGFEQCLTTYLGRAGRGPVLGSLRDVAVESDGSLLGATGNVSHGVVIRVHPETGRRTVVASGTSSSSPAIRQRLRARGSADGRPTLHEQVPREAWRVTAPSDAKAWLRTALGNADVALDGRHVARFLERLSPAERRRVGERLYAAMWALMRDSLGEDDPDTLDAARGIAALAGLEAQSSCSRAARSSAR